MRKACWSTPTAFKEHYLQEIMSNTHELNPLLSPHTHQEQKKLVFKRQQLPSIKEQPPSDENGRNNQMTKKGPPEILHTNGGKNTTQTQ